MLLWNGIVVIGILLMNNVFDFFFEKCIFERALCHHQVFDADLALFSSVKTALGL